VIVADVMPDDGKRNLVVPERARSRAAARHGAPARPSLRVVYGSLIITFAVAAPSVGGWPLLALALALLHYRLLRKPVAHSRRPEYWIAWLFLVRQLLGGATIALTGGPASPLMPWLIVAAATLPLRFTTRGIALGLAVTAGVLVAATAGTDARGLAEHPALVAMTLAVLVCVSAYSATLMRAELEHRGDSILDPLTGLLNRRTLAARVEELRQQAPASTRAAVRHCLRRR
jgi:hypothetical protein